MPITWKNVAGDTGFNAAAYLMRGASQNINQSTDALAGIVGDQQQQQKQNFAAEGDYNTNRAKDIFAKYLTPEALAAAQADGSLTQQLSALGPNIDQDLIRTGADERKGALQEDYIKQHAFQQTKFQDAAKPVMDELQGYVQAGNFKAYEAALADPAKRQVMADAGLLDDIAKDRNIEVDRIDAKAWQNELRGNTRTGWANAQIDRTRSLDEENKARAAAKILDGAMALTGEARDAYLADPSNAAILSDGTKLGFAIQNDRTMDAQEEVTLRAKRERDNTDAANILINQSRVAQLTAATQAKEQAETLFEKFPVKDGNFDFNAMTPEQKAELAPILESRTQAVNERLDIDRQVAEFLMRPGATPEQGTALKTALELNHAEKYGTDPLAEAKTAQQLQTLALENPGITTNPYIVERGATAKDYSAVLETARKTPELQSFFDYGDGLAVTSKFVAEAETGIPMPQPGNENFKLVLTPVQVGQVLGSLSDNAWVSRDKSVLNSRVKQFATEFGWIDQQIAATQYTAEETKIKLEAMKKPNDGLAEQDKQNLQLLRDSTKTPKKTPEELEAERLAAFRKVVAEGRSPNATPAQRKAYEEQEAQRKARNQELLKRLQQ